MLNSKLARNGEQLFKKREENPLINHTQHFAVPTSLNAASNQNKLKPPNKRKNAGDVNTKKNRKRKKKRRHFYSSKKAKKYPKFLISKHSHSYGTFGSNSNNQNRGAASSNSSSQVFSKINKMTLNKTNQWKNFSKFQNNLTKSENRSYVGDSYDTDTGTSQDHFINNNYNKTNVEAFLLHLTTSSLR